MMYLFVLGLVFTALAIIAVKGAVACLAAIILKATTTIQKHKKGGEEVEEAAPL